MEEPFIFRVTAEEVQLLGRRLQAGDQIAVYPGRGVIPVLDCPPNYGAVLGAAVAGDLELISPHQQLDALAAAVGLEPSSPALSRHRYPRRRQPRQVSYLRPLP